MLLSLEAALDPAASINEFVKVAGSRAISKNRRSIINFKIFIPISDKETTKTKVVYFEELYSFIIGNFFF
jgi:hypothetical protein